MSSSTAVETAAPSALALRALRRAVAQAAPAARACAAAAGRIVALSLLPGAALWTLAAASAGITDGESLRKALDAMTLGPALLPLAAGALSKAAAAFGGLALLANAEAASRGQALTAGQAFERAGALAGPMLAAAARAVERSVAGVCLGIEAGPLAPARYSFFWLAVAVDGREGRGALARSLELVNARPAETLGGLAAAALGWAAAAYVATRLVDAAGAGAWLLFPWSRGLLAWQLGAFCRKLAVGWTAALPAAFLVAVYKEAASLE